MSTPILGPSLIVGESRGNIRKFRPIKKRSENHWIDQIFYFSDIFVIGGKAFSRVLQSQKHFCENWRWEVGKKSSQSKNSHFWTNLIVRKTIDNKILSKLHNTKIHIFRFIQRTYSSKETLESFWQYEGTFVTSRLDKGNTLFLVKIVVVRDKSKDIVWTTEFVGIFPGQKASVRNQMR